MKELTAYTDTSVFGAVFDGEFEDASVAFFELVRQGRFRLFVSDVTRREIAAAPARVQKVFEDHLPFMELVPINEEVLDLRDAYISAGILSPNSAEDAAHVAAAAVAGVDLIVSWNFRHIVHFDKIRMYNAVNSLRGYKPLEIRSPSEVVDYEEEV
jgi:predicted nucleic acid-binding protein